MLWQRAFARRRVEGHPLRGANIKAPEAAVRTKSIKRRAKNTKVRKRRGAEGRTRTAASLRWSLIVGANYTNTEKQRQDQVRNKVQTMAGRPAAIDSSPQRTTRERRGKRKVKRESCPSQTLRVGQRGRG